MRTFNPEKELYKIQHRNKNKVVLFIVLLLVVSVISYSFALYQVRYSKRIIYTKVAPFSNYDLDLAVYVNNNRTDDFPENAGTEYILDHIDCVKKDITTAKWDYEQNGLSVLTNGANKCNIYFIEGVEFLYTGTIAEYTIPKEGNYKLEVWGAEGGTGYSTYLRKDYSPGGLGGYSYGEKNFNKDDKLYVVVGGEGVDTRTDKSYIGTNSGGYNGGGYGLSHHNNNTQVHNGGSGGGATHIATESGLLSQLSNKKESILIVAGGGGGGGGHEGQASGGAGGGLEGGTGSLPSGIFAPSTGGTQEKGGTGGASGNFGIGGNASGGGGGGGGAGYFGGAGGLWSPGGGGSGYISSDLTNAETTNGIREGNGYARIIYLGNS